VRPGHWSGVGGVLRCSRGRGPCQNHPGILAAGLAAALLHGTVCSFSCCPAGVLPEHGMPPWRSA
jgi:hypothetical protein